MRKKIKTNDFVIRFANVNGTGSASANDMFTKSIYRMGLPVTPKNIFPSNIQGLPTWYEVRVSEKNHLGRRAGIDILVGVNPQSFEADIESVMPGGYFVYDSTVKLKPHHFRDDVTYIGVPMMKLCMENFDDPRKQQLFKNLVYVGALVALLSIDLKVVRQVIKEQFAAKPKLIAPNLKALALGINYIRKNVDYPLNIRLEKRDVIGNRILVDGNTALALGAIYGGATVAAWYPITPSTSVVSTFEKYVKQLRVEEETGKQKYAIIQAEDELAAIGMVLGACWNGARSFTATSGAGVSLMSEFIGLSYYAEIPAVLANIQRGGPSTGMPTRTQQADLISCAYASHGDTKHPMLFPFDPKECFDMMAEAFDLAERLQTLIFLMSDLDLGMNSHVTEPFEWDEKRSYDRGKVLNTKQVEEIENWGRYKDIDGDGIGYRTIPGTHPTKGSYFTRGSSHDEYAKYSESREVYIRMIDRIKLKWETAKTLMPKAELYQRSYKSDLGMVFYGTSTHSSLEAIAALKKKKIVVDALRIRSFPFGEDVKEFIAHHKKIFVVDQNNQGQMRMLLINELEIHPKKLFKVLDYDGFPITAQTIIDSIESQLGRRSKKQEKQKAKA